MSHLGDRLSALVDGELSRGGTRSRVRSPGRLRAVPDRGQAAARAEAEAALADGRSAGRGGHDPPPDLHDRAGRPAAAAAQATARRARRAGGTGAGVPCLHPAQEPAGRDPPVAATCSSGPSRWSSASAPPRSRPGAEGRRPPGRGSPRRWSCTACSTPSSPARSRSAGRRPGPRPTRSRRAPAPRSREVRVFTLSCAASRRHQGRPPWLLAVALAVTVPGCLLTACSAPSGSPQDRTPSRQPGARRRGRVGLAGRAAQQRPGRQPALPGRPRGHRDVVPGPGARVALG